MPPLCGSGDMHPLVFLLWCISRRRSHGVVESGVLFTELHFFYKPWYSFTLCLNIIMTLVWFTTNSECSIIGKRTKWGTSLVYLPLLGLWFKGSTWIYLALTIGGYHEWPTKRFTIVLIFIIFFTVEGSLSFQSIITRLPRIQTRVLTQTIIAWTPIKIYAASRAHKHCGTGNHQLYAIHTL